MMTISPLLRVLAAAAAVLFLFTPAWSAGQAPPSPGTSSQSAETGIAEARTLMRTDRFDEALAVLRPLGRGRTVQADVVFLIGLAAIGASQEPNVSEAKRDALLDEAIASFRSMLVERPGLLRVRLELARVFFLKGTDSLARRSFEQVLASKPPAAVAANARRFLSEIWARRARRRWNMYLGASLAPDTNIGFTSNEEIIYIQGLPFRRDVDDLTTSGVGVSMWTGGEYQHRLDDRLRLRIGGGFSRRDYAGGEFDQMFVSGHAGPRWLAGENTEVSLLANARRRWSGRGFDHLDLGVRAEARHRFTPLVTANARASWHDRRYRTLKFLDGPVMDFALGGARMITSTVRADAAVGYGRESPGTERWRHTRRWVHAGVTVALPWGFTVGGSGELRQMAYQGNWFPHTPAGVSREDRTRSLRASVYNRAFTIRGFSPQLVLVNEVRTTNAQLYDYKRTGVELRFVRQF